jgi:hypothetical protein
MTTVHAVQATVKILDMVHIYIHPGINCEKQANSVAHTHTQQFVHRKLKIVIV